MALIDHLDLAKAFRRVDSDRRDDAWPDIVGYRDYKRELEENMRLVQASIQTPNRYQTGMPLVIDLPKRGFTLRPGVVPLIDDRMIYQALADLLSPRFTPEPAVYSNRLTDANSSQMFIQGIELWIAFQNQVEAFCHQYPYVVETDITAYFDHINHALLLSRISDLFGAHFDRDTIEQIKALLSRLWGRWNVGYLTNFGIPQINDASSFMANLYLDELDKWLVAHRYIYLRYVDDIRIFAESEPQARRALAELIVKMRAMGLYVASGKTKIKTAAEVLGELEQGRQRIREIEAHIDSGIREQMTIAAQMLGDFFLELVATPQNFNDRQFRFCVNRFKRLYVTELGGDIHERVIHEVLQRLSSMPESSDIFVDYLSLFASHERLQNDVLDFLESPYNIYPWQEMQLLELLIRMDLSPDLRVRANQYASNIIASGQHPASRAKAYVLRGKNGNYADRRDIRAQYNREDREDVKRAIIVAIQEMRPNERNHFFQGIAQETRRVEQTINYIQALPEPTYDYYHPPRPYEFFPPDDDSDDLYDLGSEYFV